MAIFTPGAVIGQISGSIGGSTYSHNKGGPYIRNKAIPTTSTSEYALAIKSALSQVSQSWQGEDAATRIAWKEWAKTNPIVNALGQSRVLPGHVAYIKLNATLLACGLDPLVLPPILPAPLPLTSLTVSADIGPGTFDISWTATPLAATDLLMVWAALVDSPGINHVENLYKLVAKSALAAASPLDIQTAVETRFGSASVGQVLHVRVAVVSNAVGIPSGFLRDSIAVVDTTV